MNNNAIITAVDLRAQYGQHVVWQDASFEILKGEFVALLGPNGAGKTTLMRMLLGLSRPNHGKLTIFGRSPKRGNARISYIPQRRPVDSDVNIEALEFVRLGFANRWGFSTPGTALRERQEALKALQVVDAQNLAKKAIGTLSGGELQRVFLAQALISNPELLLLDEPLANLDIRRETEFVQLVSKIAREQNVAVVLIAHNINQLLPVVDRILYVVNGKVASGSPHEIITSERLSELYEAPIEVLRDSRGRVAVLGSEEAAHHE